MNKIIELTYQILVKNTKLDDAELLNIVLSNTPMASEIINRLPGQIDTVTLKSLSIRKVKGK